jgi:hypothetical protein
VKVCEVVAVVGMVVIPQALASTRDSDAEDVMP